VSFPPSFSSSNLPELIPDALFIFIKIAPGNPALWTGMKGASAESRKNKSDAETTSA
jgi:hypothetical protein